MREIEMLTDKYGAFSDSEWLEVLVKSESDKSLGLPGFPTPRIQANFTGRSGRPALEEAFEFYRLIKQSVPKLEGPILDLGIGWGRIMRFFLKDLPSEQLFGVDIEPTAIAECRAANMPVDLKLLNAGDSLPYRDGMFQVVYAYSVFTHLPPKPALQVMNEIKRVLRPDGVVVFTALTARYLELCIQFDSFDAGTWQKSMASVFPDPKKHLQNFNAGSFVYSPIGGGGALTDDVYGWAAVPQKIMAEDWGIKVIQSHDDGSRFLQGAFVAGKA
jgi:SAM-dependent methyltransferase